MIKQTFEKKPNSLLFYRQEAYYVLLDVQPELEDEVRFKNSAFVKTGRSIPTGKYTGYELKISDGNSKPTISEVISLTNKAIDNYVQKTILSGFVWNGYKVWLNAENQQNYSSWMTAIKTNPEILPLQAKFNVGLFNEVVYYDFASVEELEDFYSKMVKFINDTVSFGRKMKNYFSDNFTLYKESLS